MYGVPTRAKGRIEAPSDGEVVECGFLGVSGWAVAGAGVSRVDLVVDGVVAGPARLGLPRPELQSEELGPESAICGFELELNLSEFVLPGQPVRLAAAVETLDRSRVLLEEITVRTRAPAAAEELKIAIVPGVVRPAGSETADAGLKVAVVANDLLRAGSQLRLLEVLANLVKLPGFAFTVFSPVDGPLRPELSALGVKVKICPRYSYESARGYAESAGRLAQELIEGGFALVWASTQIAFIGIEAARLAGLPSLFLVQQNQDVPIFWGRALLQGEIDPRVCRRAEDLFALADRVVVVCEASRRTYKRYQRNGNITVIQNSLDLQPIDRFKTETSRSEIRQRLGIAGDQHVIVCCGVIAAHKGQTTLARAFTRLAERHPEAVLVMVGDIGNRYSEGLKSYLKQAGLDGRVRILPFTDAIFEWYSAADLAVCPSQEEAQPSVVLEAMAFGVPVGSTSVGGVPEVVEDGVTGLLCSPGDVSEMEAMLERALSLAPETRREIVDAALARVRHHHDVKHAARRFRSVLEELAGVRVGAWADATHFPRLSAAARAGFGKGHLEPLLSELDANPPSYERVGVDQALAIAADMALIGIGRNASILDVGCSVGTISALLSEIGYRVTAIDNDAVLTEQDWHDPEAMAQIREEATGSNWRFVPASLAEHLSSTQQRYDCALLLSVVHHWLQGSPYLRGSEFDAEGTGELLTELCRRVGECIYLETPLADEYDRMPYDPNGEFAFPGWFLDTQLATKAELVASTVANGGRPRRLYRVDLR